MGSSQNFKLCLRTIKLTTFLMLLVFSSFIHQYFTAEGRAVSKLLESASQKQRVAGEEEEEKMMTRNEEIGSRPPRCERKCSWCRECEAVQVPVRANKYQIQSHKRSHSSSIRVAYSDRRGDNDISNYKPMSWKCKCGDLLFNP